MNSWLCFLTTCREKPKFCCKNCSKVMCLVHITEHLADQTQKHQIEILLDQPDEPVRNYLTGFLLDYLADLNEKQRWVRAETNSIIESIVKELNSIEEHINTLRINTLQIIQRLTQPDNYLVLSQVAEDLLKKDLKEVKTVTSHWQAPRIRRCFEQKTFFILENNTLDETIRTGMAFEQTTQELESLKSLKELKNYSNQAGEKSQVLIEILKSSENGKTTEETAGKALTVLCEANFDFTSQDLSGVQVSGAEINGGIFRNTYLKKSALKKSKVSSTVVMPWPASPIRKPYNVYKAGSTLSCLLFSPDQSKIIAGTVSGSIEIWDLNSTLPSFSFKQHSNQVTCLDISSNSVELVSGSSDMSVKLFDLQQKKCLLTLTCHSLPITSVKLSPDNDFIVSASNDNKIKVSTKTGEVAFEYRSSSSVTCLALPVLHDKSDTESLLYGNFGGDVVYWNFGGKKPFWTADKAHPGGVISIVLNKTAGKIITVGFDATVKIWTSKKGKKFSRYFNPRSAEINIEVCLAQSGFLAAQGVLGARYCIGLDKDSNLVVWKGRGAEVVARKKVVFKTETFSSTSNLSHVAFGKGCSVRLFEVCRFLEFSSELRY